jgi:hypothetical protein
MECAICGAKNDNVLVCGGCKEVAYCGKEHQIQHWSEHKFACKVFIPGTKVERTRSMTADPLDPTLSYPARRHGKTMRRPLGGIMHFKYNIDGTPIARAVIPGKLTPYQDPTPYFEDGSKLVKLPGGKYRHIASFSLEDLRRMGWDGAMYRSESLEEWVPFVCGYDSDPEHEYEPVDIESAKAAGVVGNPMRGLYAEMPTQGIIQIS